MIEIGDKVSFLNDKLDGIVRALAGTMARVEISDGFIVDALVKELVVTEKFMSSPIPEVSEVISDHTAPTFQFHEKCIEFIAAPSELHKVLTGGVSYYLSNATSFSLLYSFAVAEQKDLKTISMGILEPYTQKLLCSQSRESMFGWNHFSLQYIISGGQQLHRPVTKDLPVLLPDLNVTHQIHSASFAKHVLLTDFNLTEKVSIDGLKDQLETKPLQKKNFESPYTLIKNKNKFSYSGNILLNSKEVDLHIEELTTDISGMDHSSMINLQLQTLRNEMDAAILGHFKSIIFIHGVGNGKLKQAVLTELKNYPDVAIKDASFEKYGNGATEVIF